YTTPFRSEDAKALGHKQRRPLGPCEKLDDRNFTKKTDALPKERHDDAQRREDRNRGAGKKDCPDPPLAFHGLLCQLLYRFPDFVQGLFVFAGRHWYIADVGDELGARREIILHKHRYLRPGQRFFVDVDQNRPGKRRVAAAVDVLGGGEHGAAASVDGDCFHLVAVFIVVGVPQIAQAAQIALYSCNEDVVVFAGGVVGAACAGLTHNCLRKVVKGARIGAGAVETQGDVGPLRADVAPPLDRAPRLPNGPKLLHREGVDPVVSRVDDHGEAVVGHRELEILDAPLFGLLRLSGGDGARGVLNVGLAAQKLLKPAAGARNADREPDAWVGGHKLLRDGRRGGYASAGAVDPHVAGHEL